MTNWLRPIGVGYRKAVLRRWDQSTSQEQRPGGKNAPYSVRNCCTIRVRGVNVVAVDFGDNDVDILIELVIRSAMPSSVGNDQPPKRW
eukprot:CAMPEP_0175863788 /NCGR_PEP_ID=MMETSP0107_2-20121207/32676_1 /TAXON_ID=195067 ORGANISM="Goniomonas pacifica, Strain CCMP1869" /NCGR_SAMPLE_ID=MMETSP0107_2 /ASSEMBLY_ACC=CAM_ASM_000203 /LENGTH=87 /DNA_ID=CAMNT_0017180899 /DNA_START=468 /DNA_END=731 /DNA_ORIENTATION=-